MQSEDSLAAGNLIAVIAHMYGCKVIDAATMYSLLEHLQSRWVGISHSTDESNVSDHQQNLSS